MAKIHSFRVGKVQGYLRGDVWYLCYYEQGRRHRPRVGADRDAAKQMAALINGQLETGAPAALSFEPISIPQLRERWLDHHEQVLRSSVPSIQRYRTATEHLLRFLKVRPVKHASLFQVNHAEEFVRYLRAIRISPNGHANTTRRPLMDKGIRYILECSRTLFNFAAKRRHLLPYDKNPFTVLDVDRLPVETARSIVLMTADEEARFLGACDDWQFPVFATLMLTGMRPGELCHLLLPGDIDFANGVLRLLNKPKLGWQVKTRNQRELPLLPELAALLRRTFAGRTVGSAFCRRRASAELTTKTEVQMERDLMLAIATREGDGGVTLSRAERLTVAKSIWNRTGAVDEDRIRIEFGRVANAIGLVGQTAPKVQRQFATLLQEGRVDPLVRNLLMGHSAGGERGAGSGLGMTAVYTHTRAETIREQLIGAFKSRPLLEVIESRVSGSAGSSTTSPGQEDPRRA